jgi:hypothetical protein
LDFYESLQQSCCRLFFKAKPFWARLLKKAFNGFARNGFAFQNVPE